MANKGLLSGVKVLDMTRVLAGPYCCMMLADMGADVIKIELPGRGDDSRGSFPIIKAKKEGAVDESGYYMNLNRNKQGITLNLKSEKGKEIFKKLVAQSDIVVENYRPGVMEKLGLGYETLRQINPGIVYGCVSGFGHFGPYSQRAGYDIIGQAMSGLMSTTGWPGGSPTRTGTAMADVMAGMSCCIGILGAYINKLKTGEGDKVDVALVDSMVSSLEIINVIYLMTGRVPERIGNRYESLYPYDSFRCADGECVIAGGNDKLFGLIAGVIGRPELTSDARFLHNIDRVTNHAELKPIIEEWSTKYTIDEVVKAMLDVGVPAGPINTIDRVAADPHIVGARKMFVECEHPTVGTVKMTGNQIKLTNNAIDEFRAAPLLSEHTRKIFTERLGMTDAEVDQLVADKIV